MERRRSIRRRQAYKTPLGEKLKDFLRQFVAFMFSNVGIIGLVVGYTIAGTQYPSRTYLTIPVPFFMSFN